MAVKAGKIRLLSKGTKHWRRGVVGGQVADVLSEGGEGVPQKVW